MFRYEDGKGTIIDENGHEAMDFEIDEQQYALENISSYTQYLSKKPEEPVNSSSNTEVK